ncbi:tetratricopeptide repeat protein [Thaumasiovibrio subtropicus]|uniref:tetratricopeptide repeat protein n=1 Tax=Thaumasiovibrio subtropicus TaxID=1891207 RepID=UPI000B358207|nr:tetratricopeptide repeat protein [Thaumasiovibrio subtropicus]
MPIKPLPFVIASLLLGGCATQESAKFESPEIEVHQSGDAAPSIEKSTRRDFASQYGDNGLSDEAIYDLELFNYMQDLAFQGDIAAMTELGLMHLYGEGTPVNTTLAEVWLKKAADAGSPYAQHNLAYHYISLEDEKKRAEAVHLFNLAYSQDFLPAQLWLGILYYYGNAVEQDDARAYQLLYPLAFPNDVDALTEAEIDFFRWPRSEEGQISDGPVLGHPEAQYLIGEMYYLALGVEQDLPKAHQLFLQSAEFNVKAMARLGTMYIQGDGIPKEVQTGLAWVERAAEMNEPYAHYVLAALHVDGDITLDIPQYLHHLEVALAGEIPDAYCLQGMIYADGVHAPLDNEKALTLLNQGAELQSSLCQRALGNIYLNGFLGVEASPHQAIAWYRQAAESGDLESQINLGELYATPEFNVQNEALAIYWTQKAADRNAAAAINNLGYMHEVGIGVSADQAQALAFYQQADNLGNKSAAYNLGRAYEAGHGVNQDFSKAASYYQKAVNLGHIQAMHSLAILYIDGRGVSRDFQQARSLFESANSLEGLGYLYEHGLGVPKDEQKALEYYAQAGTENSRRLLLQLKLKMNHDKRTAQ